MSLVAYSDYRVIDEAWWNETPRAWNVVRLKDVGQLQGGSGFPHEHQDTQGEDLAFYKVADLARSVDGITMGEGQHTVSRHTASLLRAAVIPAGAVVYAKIGAALLLNRRRLTSKECCIDNNMSAFIPDTERLNPRYAMYWLETIDFGKVVNPGAVPSLSEGDQAILRMALPPDRDQKAVVAFLNRETAKIDDLIAEQERLVGLLGEKRQAVISHAVTKGLDPSAPMKDSGVEWVGMIPAHWSVKRLRKVGYVQTGVAKGRNLDAVDIIQVPYMRVANVQAGFIDVSDVSLIDIGRHEMDRYLLQKGDVLMNEGGDFDKLGRGQVWSGEINPCVHQNHVFAVRPTEVEPEWLALITASEYGQHFFKMRANQSTNLASISSSNLRELPVICRAVQRCVRQTVLSSGLMPLRAAR